MFIIFLQAFMSILSQPQYELDLGSWGQNIFMLPDQTSLDEIKFVLDKKSIKQ